MPKLDPGAVVTFGRKRGVECLWNENAHMPGQSMLVMDCAASPCTLLAQGCSSCTLFIFPPEAKQAAHFTVRKEKGWQCENPRLSV